MAQRHWSVVSELAGDESYELPGSSSVNGLGLGLLPLVFGVNWLPFVVFLSFALPYWWILLLWTLCAFVHAAYAPWLGFWANLVWSVCTLVLAWLSPPAIPPAARLMILGPSIVQIIRCELMRQRRPFFAARNPTFRFFYTLTMHDVRAARPNSDGRLPFALLVLQLAGSGAALGVAEAMLSRWSTVALLRWPALLAHFLGGLSVVDSLVRLGFGAFGFYIPSNFVGLLESRTLSQVWQRWNRGAAVSLHQAIFEPLGKGALGALACFSFSAVQHCVSLIALGQKDAQLFHCLLFFVLQIPLLAMERALKLRGLLWTFSCLLLLPLFLDSFWWPQVLK